MASRPRKFQMTGIKVRNALRFIESGQQGDRVRVMSSTTINACSFTLTHEHPESTVAVLTTFEPPVEGPSRKRSIFFESYFYCRCRRSQYRHFFTALEQRNVLAGTLVVCSSTQFFVSRYVSCRPECLNKDFCSGVLSSSGLSFTASSSWTPSPPAFSCRSISSRKRGKQLNCYCCGRQCSISSTARPLSLSVGRALSRLSAVPRPVSLSLGIASVFHHSSSSSSFLCHDHYMVY